MCSLFVLLGVEPEFPILVAANRDEMRERMASPPGLLVGTHRKILSPRDRCAGGTWMGVNDRMWFAGLTNVAGGHRFADATSRGALPHLVLDQVSFEDIELALATAVAAQVYNDFQLLVTDGTRVAVFRHVERVLHTTWPTASTLTLTNEHDLNALAVPDLDRVRAAGVSFDQRVAILSSILLDEGRATGHRVLKTGGSYGTVSSSILVVPRQDPRWLVWRYAPGPPDTTPYRNYGNLGRRLVEA